MKTKELLNEHSQTILYELDEITQEYWQVHKELSKPERLGEIEKELFDYSSYDFQKGKALRKAVETLDDVLELFFKLPEIPVVVLNHYCNVLGYKYLERLREEKREELQRIQNSFDTVHKRRMVSKRERDRVREYNDLFNDYSGLVEKYSE